MAQQVARPMAQQVVQPTARAMSGMTDGAPGRWCETAWATGSAGNRQHRQQAARPTVRATGGPPTVHPTGGTTDSTGNGWPTDSTPNRRHDRWRRLRVARPMVWATDGMTNIVTLQTYGVELESLLRCA